MREGNCPYQAEEAAGVGCGVHGGRIAGGGGGGVKEKRKKREKKRADWKEPPEGKMLTHKGRT